MGENDHALQNETQHVKTKTAVKFFMDMAAGIREQEREVLKCIPFPGRPALFRTRTTNNVYLKAEL